jgi:hypothetical protein
MSIIDSSTANTVGNTHPIFLATPEAANAILALNDDMVFILFVGLP